MNLRVKIKRVKDVELPKYAKPGDSGFDLVAAEDTIIGPGRTKVIHTGLGFEIPPGYELQVRPRSGISRKTFLRVVLGTVDSGFRGEVGVIVSNTSYPGNTIPLGINDDNKIYMNVKYKIKKGDRIAQGVIAPVVTAHFEEVDELSDSERGNRGFGSTGVK
ncbi:dUTP diphosphatase [Bacillus wiedmannii]|uniref:dUTP diphosphatase n=1 Tax=Bacillus wiedmannii TaxID=1890302 RepID=UPI000BFD8E57|nr:dUTP diphosphatase [Bacillus wiedmannii]PHF94214.1 deoxyuridine 5'-triphosphate nucleotidohydrolase [Bacillus wiedmannii]